MNIYGEVWFKYLNIGKFKSHKLISYKVPLYFMTKYCKRCKSEFPDSLDFCSYCKKILYPYSSIKECTIFKSDDNNNEEAFKGKIF